MSVDRDVVVKDLVDWYFEVDPATSMVYMFVSENEDSPEEPLKLLQVNDETMETGRVDAFLFAGTEETPFFTAIALVTPDEMKRIEAGEIALPEGWELSRAEKFERGVEQRAA